MHATTVSTGRYGTSFSREEGHHRCERCHLVTRTAALAFRSRIPLFSSAVVPGRIPASTSGPGHAAPRRLAGSRCSAGHRLGRRAGAPGQGHRPSPQPRIGLHGTAPGPRRRGSKPGLLVATSMGSALEGVAIRGEWPHIAVTRVRPPSRTTLLPGCGNGPKNGPKTPYGAYRAILVPVRFRGADLLGVSGSVEHPGRIVLTSLSLRPVYLPQR